MVSFGLIIFWKYYVEVCLWISESGYLVLPMLYIYCYEFFSFGQNTTVSTTYGNWLPWCLICSGGKYVSLLYVDLTMSHFGNSSLVRWTNINAPFGGVGKNPSRSWFLHVVAGLDRWISRFGGPAQARFFQFNMKWGYLCVHSVYALVLPTFVNNYNIAGWWVIIFKWHYQGWKYIGVGQLSIARKNMQR